MSGAIGQRGGRGLVLSRGVQVVRYNAEVQVTGTSSETTLRSHDVPANLLAADRLLRLTCFGQMRRPTGGGNTFTIRLKFGGTTIGVHSTVVGQDLTYGWLLEALIAAVATNEQRAYSKFSLVDPAAPTTEVTSNVKYMPAPLTIDTTAIAALLLTGQISAADAGYIKLRSQIVEVI